MCTGDDSENVRLHFSGKICQVRAYTVKGNHRVVHKLYKKQCST